jgi:cytochrome c oxidase subunit III
MLWGLSLNIALATIFLAMRAIEWHSLNFTWSSDAHGSIVWAILFLHTYDIVSDQLATIVLLVIIARGGYHERHRLGVHVDGGLWYFLMASWLPLYFLIYWGPRILGTP